MKLVLMSFVLACNITIEAKTTPVSSYKFTQVNSVEITKRWRDLGSSCVIKLPGLKFQLEKLIHPGAKVKVALSYAGLKENVEFEGYVRRVKPSIPYEIECEDEVYLFRKVNINKSFQRATLKEIVSHIIGEVSKVYPGAVSADTDLPVVNFQDFRIQNANAAFAIQQFRESPYGLTAYFRNKKLFVGLAYQKNNGTVKHSLAWNVIDNSLTFRYADEVRLKVKAIAIFKNNTKMEFDLGDDDGEHRTLYFYNVKSADELKKLATEELKKLKYDGLQGGIQTFLYPYAEPLMTCDLKDPLYDKKREGRYVIDSVKTTFSYQGARREIELGAKVSV